MILSLSSHLQFAIRVFNFKTRSLLLLVIYFEINPIDLPFGHISHVVSSVCYLLETILNIKYKFWENLNSRFDLGAVVAIVQLWNKSYMLKLLKHGMYLLNCKRI